MAANAGLIFLSIALLLVPCVVALRAPTPEGSLRGLLAVVSLAGFGGLGLVYSTRKGDLSWLASFSKEKDGN